MQELISLRYDEDRITLSARELHEFLEVKTQFKDWFPRMCEYGFVEETDFSSKLSESTGRRPAIDYQITIDMAKEIATRSILSKFTKCYHSILRNSVNVKSLRLVADGR